MILKSKDFTFPDELLDFEELVKWQQMPMLSLQRSLLT